MFYKLLVLIQAYVILVVLPHELNEDCPFSIYTECCPSMPTFINDWSYSGCVPTDDDKSNHLTKQEQKGEYEEYETIRKGRFSGSCVVECAFKNEGYMKEGSGGKQVVNIDAIKRKLKEFDHDNKWSYAMKVARENCTEKPPEIQPNQTCPSGANDVFKCLYYQMLSNCPDQVNSYICSKRLDEIVAKKCKDDKGKKIDCQPKRRRGNH